LGSEKIQLPYTALAQAAFISAVDPSTKEDKANKGIANGYAPLDATSKVPSGNLPTNLVTTSILANHEADTTSVHGIANTANLVLTNDSRLNTATTSANGLMSLTDKSKLNGVASGAEVNVNADWNATSGDAQILNKPKVDTDDLTSVDGYGGASVYNGNYYPYRASTFQEGNDIIYTGANDLGGGIFPGIVYCISGVAATGSFSGATGNNYIASTYTGWIIVGEEDVIAFSDDAGRYDLPVGEFYTLPNGAGTFVVSIEEGDAISGGEIITSGGGGTIDTRAYIQLGLAGSRTTISNQSSAGYVAVGLPSVSGTLALKSEIKNFYTAVTYTSNYTIAPSSSAFTINRHFYFTVSGTPNQNEIIFPDSGYLGDIITVTNSSVKINGSANSFNLTINLPAGGYVSAFTDSLLAGTTRSYVFSNGWIRLSPAVHSHSISDVTSLQSTLIAFAIALG
jgi:hypothetical protein